MGALSKTFLGFPATDTGSAIGVGVKVGDGIMVGLIVGRTGGIGVGGLVIVGVGIWLIPVVVGVTVTSEGSGLQAASKKNSARMMASRTIGRKFIYSRQKVFVLLKNLSGATNFAKNVGKRTYTDYTLY